jgi:hypothetical protein
MDLFKGALFLVDGQPPSSPLSQGFEPVFGNAAATRLWLQDTFAAANDSAPATAAAETEPEADLETCG